jgi:redox-sensing transcriptional repressor
MCSVPAPISEKTIGRLSLYRRVLDRLLREGVENLYSHQLASSTGGTAAQVRRDLMSIGFTGSPARGYRVQELLNRINDFLGVTDGVGVALVGVGNLGRALLAYFPYRRPSLSIIAAFDRDPERAGRVINGCRCYAMEELVPVVREQNILVGIVAVPAAEAQNVATALTEAGVTGLLNFAPTPLRVPAHVRVEYLDMTMSLEKVAYFARQRKPM